MKIAVVDGHAEAGFLIGSLLSKKHKVVAINRDRQYCEYLAEMHRVQIVNGDGSKEYILDEAKIKGFDLIVSLNEEDATNLVVCQLAKRRFAVRKAVAVVSNPASVEIFKKLGVNTALSSAHLVAKSIERASDIETLSASLTLAQGAVAVSEICVTETDPVCDKTLASLNFPIELNVSCVVRGTEALIPRGTTAIRAGDTLVIVTKSGNEAKAYEAITGKKAPKEGRS